MILRKQLKKAEKFQHSDKHFYSRDKNLMNLKNVNKKIETLQASLDTKFQHKKPLPQRYLPKILG